MIETTPSPAASRPKRIFIGVAWPYASGPRHLGHAAGAYVPADIFARYHRLAGNHVLMVSGSDMHGTPITLVADRRGVPPRQVAEENHQIIADAFAALGMSYDLYTTTLTPNHYRVTQDVFQRLHESGFLYTDTAPALFDPVAERFLPDRYVEGTCPICGFPDARGDQCDNCGNPLDPIELISPRSKITGATPEVRDTTHFFFDLPRFTAPLQAWLDANRDHLRPNVVGFCQGWLKDGLKPRAITRDIEWGVPIPLPGYDDKRIYVWFDAVIGYLSAAKEWAERQDQPDAWKAWWLPEEADGETIRPYYFVGKDNISFHAIFWPAMLLGYGGLALPYDVTANEFLTLEGQKLSSSRVYTARLPSLPEFLELFEADALRFFVTINAPESRDTDFSWEEFQRRNNDELVATYGNAVHRLLTFTYRQFDGRVPEPGELSAADRAMLDETTAAFATVGDQLAGCHFREALRLVMGLAQSLNRFLDTAEPWKVIKHDRFRAATSLWTALQVVGALRVLTAPFMPASADRLDQYLGGGGDVASLGWTAPPLPAGQPLAEPRPLFRKIEDDELTAVIERLAMAETSDTGQPATG